MKKIVRHISTGILIGKKRKKLRKQLPFSPLKVNQLQVMVFSKILQDIRNISLGFFVRVCVLDVNDNAVARTLKILLDRPISIRKIKLGTF